MSRTAPHPLTVSAWGRWLRRARDVAAVIAVAWGVSELVAIVRAPQLARLTPAPVTTGTTLQGAAFDLAELRGAPVFVNLWATWCGPCRGELPDLAASAKAHSNVRFIGLALSSSDAAEARALTTSAGVAYPNLLLDPATEARWRVSAVPSSVLLDAEGRVVWTRAGVVDERDVDAALQGLTAQ